MQIEFLAGIIATLGGAVATLYKTTYKHSQETLNRALKELEECRASREAMDKRFTKAMAENNEIQTGLKVELAELKAYINALKAEGYKKK